MKDVLKALSSLRLTVVLLSLSMVLILAGTLAQVESGVWMVVDDYFRSAFVRVDFQLFVPKSVAKVPGAIVIPGGMLLGVGLFVNLLSAHVTKFRYRWKNAGIIVVHLGIILLLTGEFVTAIAAREGRMSILEGASANYAEDIRRCELAIIEESGAESDLVVVVPESKLSASPNPIHSSLLPCDIRVDQWLPNSRLDRLQPGQSSAIGGAGRMFQAVGLPRANGVDGSNVDVPSAVITFLKDGRELGRLLVSVHLIQPQEVLIDGKTYSVALRFERQYKPYRIELIDFRHDKFVGTETPRNFSSLVRLVNEARGVDREVLISMNNPLRYAGETFYQASYKPDNTGTVLQVVRNPGWLIPYLSCAMVSAGMLFHFGRRMLVTGRHSR